MPVTMVSRVCDVSGVLNACHSTGGILSLDCDTAPAEASLLVMASPLPSMRKTPSPRVATTDDTHTDAILRDHERFGARPTATTGQIRRQANRGVCIDQRCRHGFF